MTVDVCEGVFLILVSDVVQNIADTVVGTAASKGLDVKGTTYYPGYISRRA